MLEQNPAGFVTLQGDFFIVHRDETMHLIHHVEEREKTEHPLKRIMAIEEKDNVVLKQLPIFIWLAVSVKPSIMHAKAIWNFTTVHQRTYCVCIGHANLDMHYLIRLDFSAKN